MIPQIPIAVIRPEPTLALVWFALAIADAQGNVRRVEPTPEAIETQVRGHFPDFQSYYFLETDPRQMDALHLQYRKAWRAEPGSVPGFCRITVDLEAAKTAHREIIAARSRKLSESMTSDILRAVMDGDFPVLERLRARRSRIENAAESADIDKATTLAELGAIDPLSEL